MALGSFGSAVACLLLYLSDTYLGLIIAQIVFGFAMTLCSGADSAWLFDYFKKYNYANKYSVYEGKVYSLSIVTSTITMALGGLIFEYVSLAAPFLFCSFFYLCAAGIVLTLDELKINAPHQLNLQRFMQKYYAQIHNGFRVVITNRNLLFFLIIFSIFFSISQLNIWINQLYFKENKIPVTYFGFIIAGLSFGKSFIAWNIGRLKNKFSILTLIIISCVILIISFSGLGIVSNPYSFIFLVLLSLTNGLFFPIIKQEINFEITEEYRATVLSVQSASGNLLFAMLAPLYGKLIDIYPLKNIFIVTSIVLFIALSILFHIFLNKLSFIKRSVT
jgi:MFS family permease